MEHVNTWTSSITPVGKRNPVRSQIDFIIAPIDFRKINTNARAYDGLITNTDHKLVISSFHLNIESRRKMYPSTTTTKPSSIHHLKEHANEYNNLVEKDLENININSNASIYWKSIVESCTNISENLKPNTDKKIRFKNDRICQLSNQQKDLRLENWKM